MTPSGISIKSKPYLNTIKLCFCLAQYGNFYRIDLIIGRRIIAQKIARQIFTASSFIGLIDNEKQYMSVNIKLLFNAALEYIRELDSSAANNPLFSPIDYAWPQADTSLVPVSVPTSSSSENNKIDADLNLILARAEALKTVELVNETANQLLAMLKEINEDSIHNAALHNGIQTELIKDVFLDHWTKATDVCELLKCAGYEATEKTVYRLIFVFWHRWGEVTILEPSNSKLNGIKVLAFCEMLKAHQSLVQLDLSGNLIDDEGIEALVDALRGNTTIDRLELSRNHFGDEGVEALDDLLRVNRNLIYLGLARNAIGNKHARILAERLKTNTTLTRLNLWGNRISFTGVQALAKMLHANITLTDLDLGSNSIGLEPELGLSVIGDRGALVLAEVLMVNSTLTHLNLAHDGIGDEGALALAKVLMTNATLTWLNLADNHIGNSGVQALAEALVTNSTLTHLNLNNLDIDNRSGQAILAMLQVNTSLVSLDLPRDSISKDLMEQINARLQINRDKSAQRDSVTNSSTSSSVSKDMHSSSEPPVSSTYTLPDEPLSLSAQTSQIQQPLAEVSKTHSTLTHLSLGLLYLHTDIDERSAQAIVEVLRDHPSLVRFYSPPSVRIPEDWNKKIYAQLKLNQDGKDSAIHADLSAMWILPTSAGWPQSMPPSQAQLFFAEAPSNLTDLSLALIYFHDIDDKSAQVIVEMLRDHPSLIRLYSLPSVRIPEDLSKKIGAQLKLNRDIRDGVRVDQDLNNSEVPPIALMPALSAELPSPHLSGVRQSLWSGSGNNNQGGALNEADLTELFMRTDGFKLQMPRSFVV